MTINSVELDKIYHIAFLGAWSSFEGDYKFVGFSSPGTVKMIDKTIDIYKTYFEDFDMDYDTYDLYVTTSTLVYIAYKVTGKDPVSIDEETPIYIPSTLVDFAKSYSYIEGYRLSLTVTSGIKTFDSKAALDSFISKTQSEIKDTVGKLDNYAGETISVSTKSTTALTTQAEVDTITAARAKITTNKNKSKQQYQMNIEAAERNLYEKVKANEASKENYETLSKTLSSKINQTEALRSSNAAEAATLNEVKNIMVQMMTELISGETVISSLGETGSIAFDNLYKQAKENLSS